MAINKKLIHFNKKSDFNTKSKATSATDTSADILYSSIVFIKDTLEIWTHGTFYAIPDTYKDKITDLQSAITAEATARTTAITNAVNALDATVTSTDGTNVQIKVTETDGKITAVNVTTDNTAKTADLTSEIARAKSAENTLTGSINSLNTTVTDEVARATAAENKVAADLTTETSRAKNTEKVLSDKIDIINGDNTVVGSIAHSLEDAKQYTDDEISKLNVTVTDSVAAEVTRAKAAESTISTNLSSHISNTSNPHSVTKSQIGLGNVTNDSLVKRSEMGVASGVATLDTSGKVPSSQLPSYVDDVIEATSKSNFPTTGETGKIYIDTSTNKTYRWSGTTYVEISASLALGETSSTAYAGDKGAATTSKLNTHTSDSTIHITSAERTAWNAKTSNTGTVTSVKATGSNNITVSGSPITTSGTLTLGVASGYSIPSTSQQSTWSSKQDAISDLSTIRSNASAAIKTISAVAGSNINSVGTPSVTASTSNNATTLTFNYLKGATGDKGATGATGAKGDKGDTGAAGKDGADGKTWKPSVSSAGVLSWTQDTSTTAPTSVNIKGATGATGAKGDKGDTGDPSVIYEIVTNIDTLRTSSEDVEVKIRITNGTSTTLESIEWIQEDYGLTLTATLAGKDATGYIEYTSDSQIYWGGESITLKSGNKLVIKLWKDGKQVAEKCLTVVADGTTPSITMTASVSNTVGTPSVTVTKGGTTAAPTFNLAFSNLKGESTSSAYTLPAATSSSLGGIKTGYTTSGRNYKVQLDSSNNAYVNVPWSDTTSISWNNVTNKKVYGDSDNISDPDSPDSCVYYSGLVPEYDQLDNLDTDVYLSKLGWTDMSLLTVGSLKSSQSLYHDVNNQFFAADGTLKKCMPLYPETIYFDESENKKVIQHTSSGNGSLYLGTEDADDGITIKSNGDTTINKNAFIFGNLLVEEGITSNAYESPHLTFTTDGGTAHFLKRAHTYINLSNTFNDTVASWDLDTHSGSFFGIMTVSCLKNNRWYEKSFHFNETHIDKSCCIELPVDDGSDTIILFTPYLIDSGGVGIRYTYSLADSSYDLSSDIRADVQIFY